MDRLQGVKTFRMTEEPLAEDADPGSKAIVVVGLAPTFQAFGLVLDFLSESDPFGSFEVSALVPVIRRQLQDGHNLAAMQGDRMVGYAGWLHTTAETGNEWSENRAILTPLPADESDAAALTIFVSSDKSATQRLIRGARETNKGRRVFFKRGYDGTLKKSRKSTVLNFSVPE